mmetsp:Transcript_29831/g.65227  ORF Transcript_29831/g.65227 Transcript_29831/m.65227 type:complete len:281 (+) Transcript_29831:1067-1909(+)
MSLWLLVAFPFRRIPEAEGEDVVLFLVDVVLCAGASRSRVAPFAVVTQVVQVRHQRAHIILAAASASAAAAAAVGAVLKLAHREHGRVGEHGQLGGLGCVVEERAGAERVVVERPVKIAKFVALQIVLQLTLPHGRGFDQVACGELSVGPDAAPLSDEERNLRGAAYIAKVYVPDVGHVGREVGIRVVALGAVAVGMRAEHELGLVGQHDGRIELTQDVLSPPAAVAAELLAGTATVGDALDDDEPARALRVKHRAQALSGPVPVGGTVGAPSGAEGLVE